MHRTSNRSTRRATGRHTRRPTGRAGLAALAAAALAATLGAPAALAAPDRPGPLDHGEDQLSEQVWRAAQDAQQQRRGMGSARTSTPATEALEAGMATMVADGAVGVTARVESPGLSWRGADGVRDQGRKAPAGWQDRFRVASNTKTMVATLVLQEVEAGSWTLDTRVEDVIPGLV